MRVVETVVRVAKLSLFVGWGTALAVLGACSSTTVKPDSTGARDQARPGDAARRDAGPDAKRSDALVDRSTAPDRRGWDVPLE